MNSSNTIQEKFLYDIWRNQAFDKEIYTNTGQKVVVYEAGELNVELGGPDFVNARIKIGEITYVGDIEIDSSHNDWKKHGHNLNNRFNKVILHVILKNDSHRMTVQTRNGRKIPSVCISSLVHPSYHEAIQDAINSEIEDNSLIHCHEVTQTVPEEVLLNHLRDLGIERFKKKCEKMVYRLRELIYLNDLKIEEPELHYSIPKEVFEQEIKIEDLNVREIWEQLLYESLFEALGYSQNKNIMRKLAQSVDIKFMKSLNSGGNFIAKAESALLNVSGIIPSEDKLIFDETSEYLREIVENWKTIQPNYSGSVYHNDMWTYFKLRPQNFPTIRIAGGARYVDAILNKDLIRSIVKKFVEIRKPEVLASSVRALFIVKSDGYWAKHYVFDKRPKVFIKYFVGSSRADEIMINVLLPFIYIYFDLFGRKKLSAKTLEVFSVINMDDENNLVKDISHALHLETHWKSSLIYQGMIELFRTYCSKSKCADCVIGTEVFGVSEELNC